MRSLWQIVGVNSPEPWPAASFAMRTAHTATRAASSWPEASPAAALAARRDRLRARWQGTAVFASGSPRARNFPHNTLPFRAESHFLYFVGRQLEGAALVIDPAGSRLYVPAADPSARLWHGAQPTEADLALELGLEVLPLSKLGPLPGGATLPPQDPAAAVWLSELFGRRVGAGEGAQLDGADAELAEAVIALRLVHDEAAVDQMRQAVAATVDAHV